MDYTRIYSDEGGASHFEDVSVACSPVDFAPPAPALHLSPPTEAERLILCEIPGGWFGDWHPAPRRQFWIQRSGLLEVEVSDGDVRRFTAGSLVLLEDTAGRGHVTRVVGDEGVEGVFVQFPPRGGGSGSAA